MPDDNVTTSTVPADQELRPSASRVAAPRLSLDKTNNVINLDTNETLSGIVTFGARVTTAAPDESPITAMQRWSAARQSSPKATE
jgi:hypothetical protein